MAVGIGDRIPDVEVMTMRDGNMTQVRTGEVLGTGKVVLFAVPAAFSPGCSEIHLPGFVERAQELAAKGVDTIACTAVNDVFVMDAWAKDRGVGDEMVMLADGNGDFAEAMGLSVDASGVGFGLRSKRYAAVIEDGVITLLEVDESGGIDASSCESVLARL